jgi:hypothetical protein
METNKTEQDAIKVAQVYINRLNTGYYKNYAEMRLDILSNIVNSEYIHVSNSYVDYLWSYIRKVVQN